ncbi:MAG: M3 family metallopeptidase [Bacteroidales bacterium]|jgi:peptidyl-dipeptidase Dcp|nr:M3 family metallopeptidase [Bacteroidales bacterium]
MTNSNPDSNSNPLLQEWNTPYELPPFELIRPEHFRPAVEEAIIIARREVDEVISDTAEPGFRNTIEALENAGELLNRITPILFNLNSSDTTPELQEAAREVSPLLTNFANDITLNPELFKKVKSVYDRKESMALDPEQLILLDRRYKGFVRGGAGLSEDDKEKFRAITVELSTLSLKFEENVLAETNDFTLHLASEDELSGLPAGVRESASALAREKGMEGWLFTLHAPSYVPFMQYADRRDLRERMFRAYTRRAFRGNEHDNRELVLRIVELRLEMARLLGYENYASYALEERMASAPEDVSQFLQKLLEASVPAGRRDLKDVEEFARTLGHEGRLERWDWAYYSEKLRMVRFSIDDEALRPYMPLDKVTEAVLGLATRLYRLRFVVNREIPVYNEEVTAYEVHDGSNGIIAILMLDFHPRKGKSGGAWMTGFREQSREQVIGQESLTTEHQGRRIIPVVSLVMNFTRPTTERPSLLSHSEMNTLLHEFGHALHGMLSDCTYESLSGTNVKRDFVELPSQIMENWAWEKEWLDTWAAHYKTGEKIPSEMLHSLRESITYNEGYSCMRQLSFGLLDMAWHMLEEPFRGDIVSFERTAMAPAELLPAAEGACMSVSFAHLFSGGYAAGYYGYKWAEVLDADAFSLFREKGIFDRETAESFRRNILEKGGSREPDELFRAFRGREPSPDALIERSGFRKT